MPCVILIGSMTALYHKHRPQQFSSVIGQAHIIQTLKNQILMKRLAHAYLFSGPRGVGKTTTARLLAKAANCARRQPDQAEPCDACPSCIEIATSRSLDVIEMDAASHTGVDTVRENIIDTAAFRPSAAPYKIFIVDEVHMLSTAAFNALLKTLEEPPAHVLFILATTDPQKLPDTIVSRCQRFTFRPIATDDLEAHLQRIAESEGVTIDTAVVHRIIKKSGGGARDAVTLLDQLIAMGEKHITEDTAAPLLPMTRLDDVEAFASALFAKDAANALRRLDDVASRGVPMHQLMNDLIELVRLFMIKKTGAEPHGGSLDVSKETMQKLLDHGNALSVTRAVHLLDILLARREAMRQAPLPQLPLELAVIEWCDATPENPVTTMPESPPAMAAPKEPEPTPPPAKQNPPKELSSDTVNTAWATCIKTIEADSPSTAFILQLATNIQYEKGSVRCTVPYRLHKDKLMDTHCRRRVEDALSASLGARATLAIDVQEEPEQDRAVEDVAALFGGEVVNP